MVAKRVRGRTKNLKKKVRLVLSKWNALIAPKFAMAKVRHSYTPFERFSNWALGNSLRGFTYLRYWVVQISSLLGREKGIVIDTLCFIIGVPLARKSITFECKHIFQIANIRCQIQGMAIDLNCTQGFFN